MTRDGPEHGPESFQPRHQPGHRTLVEPDGVGPGRDHPEDLLQIYVPLAQDTVGDVYLLVRSDAGRAEELERAVQRVIAGEVNERAVLSIRPALDATVAIYNDQSESLERRVRSGLDDRQTLAFAIKKGNTELLREYLQERVIRNEGLDLLVARAPGMAPVFVAEDPQFLHGVVRLGERAEHAVGDPPQMGPLLLEPLSQPVALAHSSHPFGRPVSSV